LKKNYAIPSKLVKLLQSNAETHETSAKDNHCDLGHVHPALGKLSVTSLERFLKKFPKKT
jgi:hypothetical protein